MLTLIKYFLTSYMYMQPVKREQSNLIGQIKQLVDFDSSLVQSKRLYYWNLNFLNIVYFDSMIRLFHYQAKIV